LIHTIKKIEAVYLELQDFFNSVNDASMNSQKIVKGLTIEKSFDKLKLSYKAINGIATNHVTLA